MTAPLARACWTAGDAREIFVTEALEGDDAIFLATHTPTQGFAVDGRDAFELGADEQSALLALSRPDRTHAFCVVQGEPGSGKSHLIRWLSINWPRESDVKLLLRRADGSLRGALEQLKLQLPAEFTPLFDNIGRHHSAAFQGRANIFLSTLADTLSPTHYETPLEDSDWCAAHLPGDLLSHPSVKTGWKGPQRILALLEGADGNRNSESASFDLFDIRDLAKSARVQGTGVRGATEALARRLKSEAETVDAFEKEGWRMASDLAEREPERFKYSIQLMSSLNRRRNDAIQNVLGISSSALKTLFRGIRQELQTAGRRLVLLLEDITSWEGLDDSLIDVLVENAAASADQVSEVCPFISVVGVTPSYYARLQANYRQRITHEIRLGDSQGGLQDVSTLRETEARSHFVARYLAAVRSGHASLRTWREEFRFHSDLGPPNPCETCPRRSGCFDTFDSVAGIGLFPFTPRSIERLFAALKENDAGQTWKTPRGIIQAILKPSLGQPELLDEGAYPSGFIEATPMRDDLKSDYALSNRLDRILEIKVPDQSQRDRMRRVLAYWADPQQADTSEVDGHLLFAGAKQGIFEAFNLPWIGEAGANSDPAPTPETVGEPLELPQPAPPREDDDEDEDDAPARARVRQRQAERPAQRDPAIPRPPGRGPTPSQQETLRSSLRVWSAGGAMENGNEWNAIVYKLIADIDFGVRGYARAIVARVITPERVKLRGTTSGVRANLVIAPEPWIRDGLEAYLAFLTGRRCALGE